MPSLPCEIHRDGEALRIGGDVDDLAVPALRSALELYGHLDPLVIDLSDAHYLSSLAVSQLVGAMRASEGAGRSFTICAEEGSAAQMVLAVLVIPHRPERWGPSSTDASAHRSDPKQALA
ncbi:STAS domain-containing protein [Nocardioides ochotonae]|uniref:STAS domain-containing protein n=1 Tax=Nocardioides ochotonae TaxID=2685869 RepID=UPI001409BE51|nr:STAS domain-containing protein [Nocardioides ochotonae]